MSSQHQNGAAIGIDFGTSFCRVASLERGALRVHPNVEGNRSTPVYLAFKEDGAAMLGDSVEKNSDELTNPTLCGIKRLLLKEPLQHSDNHPFSFDCEVRSKPGSVQSPILYRATSRHGKQISPSNER